MPLPIYRNGYVFGWIFVLEVYENTFEQYRLLSITVNYLLRCFVDYCHLLLIIVSHYHCLLSTWAWLTFIIPILFTRYSTAPCLIEFWYYLDTKHLSYLSWCCHLLAVLCSTVSSVSDHTSQRIRPSISTATASDVVVGMATGVLLNQ
jgi:hypothetical protein